MTVGADGTVIQRVMRETREKGPGDELHKSPARHAKNDFSMREPAVDLSFSINPSRFAPLKTS